MLSLGGIPGIWSNQPSERSGLCVGGGGRDSYKSLDSKDDFNQIGFEMKYHFLSTLSILLSLFNVMLVVIFAVS